MWLDRGELDKLIERSASPNPVQHAPARRPDFADSGYGHAGYGKRKHKSWLSEIFD